VISASVEEVEEYSGYKEVIMDDITMSEFYSNLGYNTYNLITNEYIILRNAAGEVVDTRCWDG
jgi:hypothetical protein